MAHTRHRQIAHLFSRLIRFSPIVGIFGHRQVGKSTYVSALHGRYCTLDDRETRRMIAENPKKFVSSQRKLPTVIDECQFEPDLFPALKERVRTDKRPGQFVLTGSVRFTSRKAIRESLAGRIANVELLPFILSELMRVPLPDAVPQLLKLATFTESTLGLLKETREAAAVQKHLETYLRNGGLPGLCFIREERLRQEALSALHHLILDRDLRLLVETRLSLETLMQWLRLIAGNGWNPYNAAAVKRELGLAHQTQKNLMYALESIFLVRRIPLRGRAGEILLMEDQYEERTLAEAAHSHEDQLLSAFYRNVRAQFQYQLGGAARFESYWTRSGARVPLVIRTNSGVLGFAVITDEKPTLSQQRSADSFLRHEPAAKMIFLADRPIPARVQDPRVLVCCMAALL